MSEPVRQYLPGEGSIEDVKKSIAETPHRVALRLAQEAAPVLTEETRATWTSGRNVYGDRFPKSIWDGHQLTLHRTGALLADAVYTDTGTLIRCRLSEPYAGYMVNWYRVLPTGNTARSLPVAWRAKMNAMLLNEGFELKGFHKS